MKTLKQQATQARAAGRKSFVLFAPVAMVTMNGICGAPASPVHATYARHYVFQIAPASALRLTPADRSA